MRKEELFNLMQFESDVETSQAKYILTEFFQDNVVIPKGTNRHPQADVIHLGVEGLAKLEQFCSGQWVDVNYTPHEEFKYRIKPSEPVYEYAVRINFEDGTFEDIEKYFTKEEFKNFRFPKSRELIISSQRERK